MLSPEAFGANRVIVWFRPQDFKILGTFGNHKGSLDPVLMLMSKNYILTPHINIYQPGADFFQTIFKKVEKTFPAVLQS